MVFLNYQYDITEWDLGNRCPQSALMSWYDLGAVHDFVQFPWVVEAVFIISLSLGSNHATY